MILIKFFFSYKKSFKNSQTRWVLSSLRETTTLINFNTLMVANYRLQLIFFSTFFLTTQEREVANCVLKDMTHLICMWRQIRGYQQGGNTTNKNSNTSKKIFCDHNPNSGLNKLSTKTIGSEFQNIFTINDNLTKIKKINKNLEK